MKIYAVIITVIAVLGIAVAGYFYWQGGDTRRELSKCQDETADLTNSNAQMQGDLADLRSQIAEAKQVVAVLQPAVESFVFPGDYKAQAVGAKETAEVAELISVLDDKTNRINAESNWSEFTTTREFNPFFTFLRGMLGSLNNALNRTAPVRPPAK